MNLVNGLRCVPELSEKLECVQRELSAMRTDILKRKESPTNDDGWLDAKRAAKYLGMSASTFDKYRYTGDIRIKGYPVGGKTLYKKQDLDSFVMLFDIKSRGLA